MERIWSINLPKYVGQKVKVAGWLYNKRDVGKIAFIIVRDRYGLLQAACESEEALAALKDAAYESVIEVEGTVVEQAKAPLGVELQNPVFKVISPVTEALPFPLNKGGITAGLDVFLEHAVVGLRHPEKQALFTLSAAFMAAFREYLSGQGFVEMQTPKIISTFSEGGANLFPLKYFKDKAYLAQSPQIYKQIMVGVFERVFEVGPVFRAEPHETIRHLNEYVSMDIEMGFIEDHTTIMAMLTNLLRSMFETVSQQHARELGFLKAKLPVIPEKIPAIFFPEAQELIFKEYKVDSRGENDLSPQDERFLGDWAKKNFNSDFLFVTGYPMSKRPFYTHPNPENPDFSNSFDLLFRGTELVTGGQRLHRYQDYLDVLAKKGLESKPFEHYLMAFKWGMPPHGGFAIGLERLLMQLLELSNIRLTALFPRDMRRIEP
jgi:nondiscriminating aspartyl-tRNA synthetase